MDNNGGAFLPFVVASAWIYDYYSELYRFNVCRYMWYIYVCICVCILNDPKANAVILPQLQCRIHAIHCENYLRWCGWCKGKSDPQYVSNKTYHIFLSSILKQFLRLNVFFWSKHFLPNEAKNYGDMVRQASSPKRGRQEKNQEFWGSTLVKRRSPSHIEDPFNWFSYLEKCGFFSKNALQHVLFLIWVLLKSELMSCVDVWNFATQMIVITTMYYLQRYISSEKQYVDIKHP